VRELGADLAAKILVDNPGRAFAAEWVPAALTA
jgi:hypothetical protein